MAKYLTEFIGTFFLVLTVGLAGAHAGNLAPLAIGSMLMVMVYMGGHVSGAHYNPAVSLAAFVRGALGAVDLFVYWIVQLLGALAAAGVAWVILGKTFAPTPGPAMMPMVAFLAEIVFTFALALVVLNVATAKKTQGNSFFGLAIGFTVLAGAFAVGPISGGAFNPAVGTGPTVLHALVGEGSWQYLWIYWAGPLTGGILAGGVFKVQEPS